MDDWGVGSFGNDLADDWLIALLKAEDLGLVDETIDEALAGEVLEAWLAERALAACERMIQLRDGPGLPEPYAKVEDHPRVTPAAALLERMNRVLDRVVSPECELFREREGTDEFDEWQASVEDLRARILSR